jgi:hypothetical protein
VEKLRPPLLQDLHAAGPGPPQNHSVVVIAIQTIFAQRIQVPVIDPRSVWARRQLNSCCIREIIGAASNYDTTGQHFYGTFDHVVPRAQIGTGFTVGDLHYDGDIRVANGTDSDGSWGNCQETIGGLLSPAIAQITLRTLILQIELEVIGKQRVFESLHHRERHGDFTTVAVRLFESSDIGFLLGDMQLCGLALCPLPPDGENALSIPLLRFQLTGQPGCS